MDNLKQLGTIGDIAVQLDVTDPDHPVLILNDNAQAERLACLLTPSNQPFDLDWNGSDDPDATILRVAYTPDVDRRIADVINVLTTLYFAVPDQARHEVTAYFDPVRNEVKA